MLKNYEELTKKIKKLLGDFTNHKFESPISKKEIEKLFNIKIKNNDWKNNRQENEYGTTDITVFIETDKDISISLSFEVDDADQIVELVGVDEQ